jgi:hypothetical protein
MDIWLINLSRANHKRYIEAIMSSDLEREIKFDLRDLLDTALLQADEAREIGWLPENSKNTSG